MKKIGILTRRAGFNHGSSLQAYAMAKFISDLGFECKILNYDEYSGNPRWKIRPYIENIQWIFFRPLIYLLAPSKYYYLHIRKQQYTKFAEFEDTFYNLTSPILTNTEALRKASSSFDALVCGSDQIWSPLSYDPVFLFNFLNDNRINTVAYAPSIGVSDIHMISDQQRKLMCKIKYLSCRELQGSEMVKKITLRDCQTVLDPTLMVNSTHWVKMASSIPNVEMEPYIVCYFLGKNVHQTYIDELKHKTGNDKEVQDYVMSFPKSVTFMEKLEDFMEFMIPLYIEEGKISLTIAIGCTGGKHRSVTMTNKLADYLKSCDYTVNVSYRDMGRE